MDLKLAGEIVLYFAAVVTIITAVRAWIGRENSAMRTQHVTRIDASA
jgi:hypothetical protein